METTSSYEKLGGEETIASLVEAFYPRVVKDAELAPLFADSDIQDVMYKQKLFLTQFLGGPQLYTEQFGHPMLRAKHMPFRIAPNHARAWLRCMSEAMDEIGMKGSEREIFYARLILTAHHMVNDSEESEEKQ